MGWSHNITNNIQWVKSYVQFWQVEGISFPYFFVAPTIPELYVAETNQPIQLLSYVEIIQNIGTKIK